MNISPAEKNSFASAHLLFFPNQKIPNMMKPIIISCAAENQLPKFSSLSKLNSLTAVFGRSGYCDVRTYPVKRTNSIKNNAVSSCIERFVFNEFGKDVAPVTEALANSVVLAAFSGVVIKRSGKKMSPNLN